MSETLYKAPKKRQISKMRVHDYLYDSAYIVSGARDYARTCFRAAMDSAQIVLQPVYATMFSDLSRNTRINKAYYPNCRLPEHVDLSYTAYLCKTRELADQPPPHLTGKDRFKYQATPKTLLAVPKSSPDFHPPTAQALPPAQKKPRNRGTQSLYRESSAQTIPWQPDGVAAETCEETPEVLYLDKFMWGPGKPYRIGDLPADFHTTEIINKLRHARRWMEVVQKGVYPFWMKKADAIIEDVETKDLIFREAEIDELQEIRLELLHRMQSQQRQRAATRCSRRLAARWTDTKAEMERKITHIRRSRDRELRKLSAIHAGGGIVGQVARMRASRGMGEAMAAAKDPASEMYAPLARHGYQARRRHATIYYDPNLLSLEDHAAVAEPPAWLACCGQDLRKSCSGHHLPVDRTRLCERETKWSEDFLRKLHHDLKKARLGAAIGSAGPLRVLRPRRLQDTPRPATPEVEPVPADEESRHQMYEGRTRAAELTEELKTTHGLQKEDKIRIAREEAKAREYVTLKTEAEKKEDAICALVDELTGGAVSAALDFLEKELRRLKEERRQHAFILIALREKAMREAAEAGRRQKEEHRRREHDEMFKQAIGVTQETVDVYLRELVQEGVELAAEEDAVRQARLQADNVEKSLANHHSMSTAEQNELVAELVNQYLLPATQRSASRHKVQSTQQARLHAAASEIFNLIDNAEIKDKEQMCVYCGCPLGDLCRCRVCPLDRVPEETESRDDPRWMKGRARPKPTFKSKSERFPLAIDVRGMMNTLVDEVVQAAREKRYATESVSRDCGHALREAMEVAIDAKEMLDFAFDRATGATFAPPKESNYHHFMMRTVEDALGRTEPFHKSPYPTELPSEIRRREDEARAALTDACKCADDDPAQKGQSQSKGVAFFTQPLTAEERIKMLPSEVRILQEMRRCKCDSQPSQPSSPEATADADTEYTEGYVTTNTTASTTDNSEGFAPPPSPTPEV